MQTALLVVGIIAIALVALAIVVLVGGVLREIRKIGKASEDLSRLLKTAEESCAELTRDTHTTLNDADKLIVEITDTVEHIDKVAEGTERLLNGALVVSTAAKAIKTSTAGLVSVLEGVKQGIKTLRGSEETNEEGTSDEQ